MRLERVCVLVVSEEWGWIWELGGEWRGGRGGKGRRERGRREDRTAVSVGVGHEALFGLGGGVGG